uniref:Uncharacterized protein n=1 Tax=Kalanchoe fedtschenkoi TaxID=63787 RepID=A0A7N0ZVN6_KALFE
MGQIQYSDKYFDHAMEYSPKLLPKTRLLTEVTTQSPIHSFLEQNSGRVTSYSGLMLIMSVGEFHRPEPHIMLFRRPLNYQHVQANQAHLNIPSKSPR